MTKPLLLFTTDGQPVFRTGEEKYSLNPKRGFADKKHQVRTLLPPDSRTNRVKLEKVKKQTGAECEWRAA